MAKLCFRKGESLFKSTEQVAVNVIASLVPLIQELDRPAGAISRKGLIFIVPSSYQLVCVIFCINVSALCQFQRNQMHFFLVNI